MKYKYIALPPGNPKLLIPDLPATAQAKSFMLYAPGSSYGKIFKKIGMLSARMGFFKTITRFWGIYPNHLIVPQEVQPILSPEVLEHLQKDWESALNVKKVHFALCLGTSDFFQKITALLFDQNGRILSIAKIGASAQAKKLIAHEHSTLNLLKTISLKKCCIPIELGFGTSGQITWLLQSVINDGKPSSNVLNAEHLAFLSEIAQITHNTAPLREISFWKEIKKAVYSSYDKINSTLLDETPFFMELMQKTVQSIGAVEESSWPLVAAHGDFAPWNMRISDGKLAVYDWECFATTAPAGWDIIRFIFMVEYLLKKRTFFQVYSQFISNKGHHTAIDEWEKTSGIQIPDRRLLATLFLIDLYVEACRSAIIQAEKLQENLL